MGRYGYGYGMPGPLARRAWTPLQLGSSLALWLRADMGITLNGATVSAWADQSGNGRHAVQAVGAAQLAYTASGIGSMPSLTATATQNMAVPSVSTPVSGSAARTVVAVYQPSSALGDNAIVSSGRNSLHEAFEIAALPAHDPTLTLWFDDIATAPAKTTAAKIVLASHDGATAQTLYSNGTLVGSGAVTLNTFTSAFVIGATVLGLARQFAGSIAEVVVVSRVLTAAERTALTRYMGSRYGITVA